MHRAAADHNQAIQGDLLVSHHLAALLLPVRLEMVLLDQVSGQWFDPVRFDLGHHARIQLGGFDQLGGHDPLRTLLAQSRRRMHPETPLTGAQVVAVFGLLADLAEQAGKNRLVQFRVVGRLFVDAQLQVTADQAQLPMGIAPFTQAQVVEEVLPAPVAQRAGGQRLALFFETTPQTDQRGKVRVGIFPLCMRLVGGLLTLRRTLARVLHRQGAGNDQQFTETALLGTFEQHAPQPRVDRQTRQLTPKRGELVLAIDRRELLQQVEAVADRLAIRRFDKREGVNLAQAQVQHLQDHRREVGTQDLRVGERWPRIEIFFAVQPHADTRFDPAAAALALVGTGL
ncbi:hypothetical protein D3C76_997400 [compost metagenome]